jgi:hypothetical protein
MLQRILTAGFISPCLPTKTDKLPSGSEWLHETQSYEENAAAYTAPLNSVTIPCFVTC